MNHRSIEQGRAAGREYDGSTHEMSDTTLFSLLRRVARKSSPRPTKRVMALRKSLPITTLGHGGVHMPGDRPTTAATAAEKPKRLLLPDGPQFTADQALERLQVAVMSGKMSGHDAQVIERAVRAGVKLPSKVRKLLAGVRL